MALPDFVGTVLEYLTDGDGSREHWNTTNFDPQPDLIDGNEWSFHATGDRARNIDIAVNDKPIITADSDPTSQNEIRGNEYNVRSRHGVRVICEAYHEDGGGQIADVSAFGNMVTEAKRSILTERRFPEFADSADWSSHHLAIEQEFDMSAEAGDAHYFRYEFPVWFVGAETLPSL